jgi:hypothetical protein
MNEFDQFIKHNLQIRHYIRYADDFVILSPNRFWLEIILREVDDFLKHQLKLKLHPDKVFIKTLASGVDFLGWIHFPDHRVLRGASRRRMMKQIATYSDQKTLSSYRGLLSHGNGHKLLAQLGDNLI